MKFLTICHGGQNRSVCLARLLLAKGHEAVAHNASLDSEMWFRQGWADRIVVAQQELAERVKPEHKHKLRVVDIGIDTWGYPENPELIKTWEDRMGEIVDA